MENMSKDILKKIEDNIALYNSLNPNETLTLIRHKKMISADDWFIGTYGNGDIDLFLKFGLQKAEDVVDIYIGHFSGKVAIFSRLKNSKITNYWLGENESWYDYRATCDGIDELNNLDQMRRYMCLEGIICDFVPKKATYDELLNTLEYAKTYFFRKGQEDKAKQKTIYNGSVFE